MEVKTKYLVSLMEEHLENMCAYLSTNCRPLFYYYAGKADGIRDILENYFYWDPESANDHIKAMWDIMDENWVQEGNEQ